MLGGLRLADRSRVENGRTGTGAMGLDRVRSTRPEKVARGIRVVLGVLFVMTGAMKLVVPMLAAAWAGQLAAADIPLPELNRSVAPFLEMGVGAPCWSGSIRGLRLYWF